MKRILLPLALAAAITVPVGAQFGWFSLNGGLIARMSSATTAVTIKQEGTGAFLDLGKGSNTYRFAPSGTSLLLQSSTGGAFSTVGTFTSAGEFSATAGITAGGTISGSNFVAAGSTNVIGWSGLSLFKSPSDGRVQVLNSTGSNAHDITLADWGTTNSAESVSVANDAVLVGPTSGAGFLVVSIGTDNNVCTFALTGTAAPVEINDPGTLCSTTATTASSINVYYSAGYQIENKRGGTRALRIQLIGG